MKKILYFIICIPVLCLSQNDKNNFGKRFQIGVGYGISYIDYAKDVDREFPDLSVADFGSLINISFDFALPKNRYIGVGFSKQIFSKSTDQANAYRGTNVVLFLDNYRITELINYYDIHFRKEFDNRIGFNFGIFYYNEYSNYLETQGIDENTLGIILTSDKQRSDNIGLSMAPSYRFKINDYLNFALVAQLSYSLNGLEHIALMPKVYVKF